MQNTKEELYLAAILGEYSGELPMPNTKVECYLYRLATDGVPGGSGEAVDLSEYAKKEDLVGQKTADGGEIFNNYENNVAIGNYSHAEGYNTKANGNSSHAEGGGTTASGYYSHAEGSGTKASSNYQHVQGKFNIEDTDSKYAFIIGNGENNSNRSNAFAIDWNGLIYLNNSDTGIDLSEISVEVTQARVDANGTSYSTLKERLDSADENVEKIESVSIELREDLGNKNNLNTDDKTNLVKAINEVNNRFIAPVGDAVNDWLDEHPEATTTVQDKSLTIDKMVVGTLGYVTPEMFGAIGDGIVDDSEAFKQMFKSNAVIVLSMKTYVLKSIDGIVVSDLKIHGNGAILKFDNLSMTNEFAITINGSGYIDFLNIYKNANKKIFGFKNCINYQIYNCNFNSSNVSENGFVDLYEDNHYFTIDSCKFDLFSMTDGGLWIRGSQANADLTTDHIIIRNCSFLHCSSDECLAIWGSNGTVKDVVIDNCNFEDYGDTTHGWMISLGQSQGTIENVIMRNCIIVSSKTTSGIIYNNSDGSKNIIIDKTEIVNNSELKNSIVYAKNTNVYDSHIISNAKAGLISKDTTKLVNCSVEYIGHTPSIYYGNFENCVITGDENSTDDISSFCKGISAKNTVFEKLVLSRFSQTLESDASIILDNCKMYNCDFSQSQLLLISYGNKINIKNCLLPYPIRLTSDEANGYVIGNYFKSANAFTEDNNKNVLNIDNSTSISYE